MDLRLSVGLPCRADWHEAEFQWRLAGQPRLTVRALVRLRPFRVIAVRRRQLRDGRLDGAEREWTWPPRRQGPAGA